MIDPNNRRSEKMALLSPAEMELVQGGGSGSDMSLSLNFEKYKTTYVEYSAHPTIRLKHVVVSGY